MNIKDFKDKCLENTTTDLAKKERWNNLVEEQKEYGKEYKMKSKIFRGNFCPICSSKLKKEFMFRNKPNEINHYIHECSCGYEYAVSWREGAIE